MKAALNIGIWIIVFIGLAGSGTLVQDEFRNGHVCPTIIGIPACYIIFICFLFVTISQTGWLKDQNLLYYLGTGVAWLIAAVGTFGQLFDYLECPKTSGGIPMCYLSFGIFSTLIILQLLKSR